MLRLITDLVELSTFLYAGQPNDRLTVLQSLVENKVGVTLDLFLLPFWSFVVFLHLFPLYVLQGLKEERHIVVIHIGPTAYILAREQGSLSYLCHDLFGQHLVSIFHYHVDKFTEKQGQ